MATQTEQHLNIIQRDWLSAAPRPYLYDCLSMFPQAGQILSVPQTLHHKGQTLQDRCGSPEGQAGTLDLVEFIALCQNFKRILWQEGGKNM